MAQAQIWVAVVALATTAVFFLLRCFFVKWRTGWEERLKVKRKHIRFPLVCLWPLLAWVCMYSFSDGYNFATFGKDWFVYLFIFLMLHLGVVMTIHNIREDTERGKNIVGKFKKETETVETENNTGDDNGSGESFDS